MAAPIIQELQSAVTDVAIPGISADLRTTIFAFIAILVLIKGFEIILELFCKVNNKDLEKAYGDIDGKQGWERDRAEGLYKSKLRRSISQEDGDC